MSRCYIYDEEEEDDDALYDFLEGVVSTIYILSFVLSCENKGERKQRYFYFGLRQLLKRIIIENSNGSVLVRNICINRINTLQAFNTEGNYTSFID